MGGLVHVCEWYAYANSNTVWLLKYVTQYNKRYILSTFEKKIDCCIIYRWFNKFSNYTKFVKIEVVLLKYNVYKRVYYFIYILHTILFVI